MTYVKAVTFSWLYHNDNKHIIKMDPNSSKKIVINMFVHGIICEKFNDVILKAEHQFPKIMRLSCYLSCVNFDISSYELLIRVVISMQHSLLRVIVVFEVGRANEVTRVRRAFQANLAHQDVPEIKDKSALVETKDPQEHRELWGSRWVLYLYWTRISLESYI